jgi:hypothetical protein
MAIMRCTSTGKQNGEAAESFQIISKREDGLGKL